MHSSSLSPALFSVRQYGLKLTTPRPSAAPSSNLPTAITSSIIKDVEDIYYWSLRDSLALFRQDLDDRAHGSKTCKSRGIDSEKAQVLVSPGPITSQALECRLVDEAVRSLRETGHGFGGLVATYDEGLRKAKTALSRTGFKSGSQASTFFELLKLASTEGSPTIQAEMRHQAFKHSDASRETLWKWDYDGERRAALETLGLNMNQRWELPRELLNIADKAKGTALSLMVPYAKSILSRAQIA